MCTSRAVQTLIGLPQLQSAPVIGLNGKFKALETKMDRISEMPESDCTAERTHFEEHTHTQPYIMHPYGVFPWFSCTNQIAPIEIRIFFLD